MFQRIGITLLSLFVAGAAFAQTQTTSDLEARVQEMKRQIDILTQEIEAIKSGEAAKKPVQADTTQYGLGAAASKVYRADQGVSFGGYGEFRYQRPQEGIASADVVRAVLYTGYKFNEHSLFNSELEVEHASTEFAGDENRGAEGGSVSVEFAYLDYLLKPSANIRAGLVLMPTGLINEQHEPTAYLGTHRPEVEDRILPTTWTELGAGVFGDAGTLSYRGYVVTGLESARFSPDEGVHEGKQGGASAAAQDLAVVGRLDWHPVEGTMFGGSIYSGGSGQGAGYKGQVTLAELHADSKFRAFSLRGLVARGHIGDAAAISNRVGETIGSSLGGWYVEGAYNVGAFTPYIRHERLDTQRRVAAGFSRDPENDRRITTFGLQYKPFPQTVIKTDWDRIKTAAGTHENSFNLGLGYIF